MSIKDKPYYQKFESLLSQLSTEVSKLTDEKYILTKENQELRQQLEQYQHGGKKLFGHLPESDKRILRGEIADMIRRLDKYISDNQ